MIEIKLLKNRELQLTDSDVTTATAVIHSACSYVMLECADDNTLIENLQFQIIILKEKLINKTRKTLRRNQNERQN